MVPPAGRMALVITTVYAVMQGLKKIPVFTSFLNGWKAVVFNIVFTAAGLLATVPADQIYTVNTLLLLLVTGAGAAGVHGTVKSLSAPTVLVIIPPSSQVVSTPATLVPDDPAAIPVQPNK
jgi:hypothetical protein